MSAEITTAMAGAAWEPYKESSTLYLSLLDADYSIREWFPLPPPETSKTFPELDMFSVLPRVVSAERSRMISDQ